MLVGFCLTFALLITAAAAPARPSKPAPPAPPVHVQLLGINDFHGNLLPPSGSSGRIGATNAGGVEFFTTHVKALEATNPNTLVVSAGDLIGASPLLSGLFHDEPTIEAANLFGLDYNGVGNHEFDEGAAELQRMQNGGCHPVDGCQDGDGFAGADFQFLAANVFDTATGNTIFPPFAIHHFQGAKIGIVGMTLEGTPSIVTPAAVAGLAFRDEADAVNALVPILKEEGVETIVVLLHEGGSAGAINETTINQCNNPQGPVIDVIQRMDEAIDVVITGHTNWAVNCVIDGKIMTGAASFGRLVTDIDLTISRATKDVVSATVNNRIMTRDVAPDAAQTALIAKYNVFAAPIANRVVGSITGDILRAAGPNGESPLGDLIADAQLAATSSPSTGGAVVAFMNAGGIRADLLFNQISGGEAPGQVTYGEIFAVQPFANNMMVVTLTGAQIEQILERQFTGGNGILQISNSLRYTWDATKPPGDRIDPLSIKINGVTVDPAASYRVAANNFLADGGDGYGTFALGTNRLGGVVDTDAFSAYMGANSPVSPPAANRITRIG